MRHFFSCFLIFAFFVSAADTSLLLHSSFDKFSTHPDFIKNPLEDYLSGIGHELQLRMYKGVANKGNAVLLTDSEFVGYRAKGNFNPKQGTVSLWVKPLNWKSSDRNFYRPFFEIRANAYRFLLYKLMNGDFICASITVEGKQSHQLVHASAKWEAGEWHQMVLTWNSSGMKLYIDGQAPAPGSSCEKNFREAPAFPEEIEWASIWLNVSRGWITNPDWTTAYDELKIYDRVLSASEILSSYEEFYPVTEIIESLVTVPAKVPIANPTPESKAGKKFSTVDLSVADNKLKLHYFVPYPAVAYDITLRDGTLWFNDCVEFHCLGDDGKQRQFIVNPSAALYDSLAGNPSWNSNAIVAAKRHDDSWEATLELPLSDLGVTGDSFRGNFCTSKGSGKKAGFTWSPLLNKIAGFASKEFFGVINLAASPGKISINELGDLRSGRLNVSAELASDELSLETEFTSSSGVSAKGTELSMPAGRAEIVITAKDKADKVLCRYVQLAEVNPPLTMNLVGFPTQDRLECRLDFSASDYKKAEGQVFILGKENNKVYAKQKFLADNAEFTVNLPFPRELPDNSEYILRVEIEDMFVEHVFRTPDMKLLASQVAVDHTVPAPWHKVELDGEQIKVLDRIYEFMNGPLPNQIFSRGEKLLSRQPVFVLNGEEISWSKVNIGKNWGDYIETSATGKFSAGRAEINGELWFDGMYKFDLSIIPDTELNIESMRLLWAVPAEQSIYAQTPAYTSWKNNKLALKWNPSEYHSLLWLSGYVNGLAWWCSSDANWIINPNINNLLVEKNGAEANVKVEMFASSAKLSTTAKYTMVFQGTPAGRPDFSLRRILQGQTWFPQANSVNVGGHSSSKVLADDNIKNWISLEALDPEKFFNYMKNLQDKGLKTRLYAMPTHLSNLDPEYDLYFNTWAINPAITWQARRPVSGEEYTVEPCCAHTELGNLHAYRIDKLYNDNPGLSGLYFDIMHCRDCNNVLHGCGGIDAFGKAYSTSIALNLRQYTLRILKIHRQHKRLFGIHAHSAFFPFVHALGDYWMPGEELFSLVEANPQWGYLEEVSAEAYQSAWNSTVRGIFIRSSDQHERISRILGFKGEKEAAFRSDDYAENTISRYWLYDITPPSFGSEKKDHLIFKHWAVTQAVELYKADFHAYWRQPVGISTNPAMKTSWFSWNEDAPYSRLFCLVNTSRETAATEIKIDWKAANCDPAKRLLDLWSGEKFTPEELYEHQLGGHKFMLLVAE